jgi:hypothetical protein
MRLILIAAVAAASAIAGSASAQSWTSHGERGERPYGYETGRHYSNSYDGGRRTYSRDWSFNGQADRPGDYRCDAFWDAERTGCGERWRDQRRGSDRYGQGRYGHGRGYGSSYHSGGAVYPGAYGRPDLVYPAGRGGHASGGRSQARIDWCRWNYRSYDPASGYYRAYSGHLVWCG